MAAEEVASSLLEKARGGVDSLQALASRGRTNTRKVPNSGALAAAIVFPRLGIGATKEGSLTMSVERVSKELGCIRELRRRNCGGYVSVCGESCEFITRFSKTSEPFSLSTNPNHSYKNNS
jgi:hypothetical protein